MKLIHPFNFLERPAAPTTYACPACNEIISIEASTCRFCKEPVDRVTARLLLGENQRVTHAVASAKTFRCSIWLAALTLIVGVWEVFANGRANIISILGGIALFYGVRWLYDYGSLDTRDPDYSVAVRRVRWTMAVWVLVQFVPFIVNVVIRPAVLRCCLGPSLFLLE